MFKTGRLDKPKNISVFLNGLERSSFFIGEDIGTTHFADFKTCPVCKKEFKIKSYSWQKYCSKVCKQKVNSKKCKEKHRNLLIGGESGLWFKKRFEILKKDNFKCQYCGRNPVEDNCKLQIEHILPKNKGGTDEMSNLITACEECNLGKTDVLLLGNQKEKLLKRLETKELKGGINE